MKKFGYYNITAVVNPLKLAKPKENVKEILRKINEVKDKSDVILFPELSLTGYTCEDLFLRKDLLNGVKEALATLVEETSSLDTLIVVGLPVETEGRLYNCAAVIQSGKLLGYVPKSYLPNYNEFYEKRWFSSGLNVSTKVDGVLLSRKQIFKIKDMKVGIEICEDIWSPMPVSTDLALEGANVILNLSASPELVAKKHDRMKMVDTQSDRLLCAYVYAGSGTDESSKDLVFGGHCFAYEAGSLLAENIRFKNEDAITFTVDVQKIELARIRNKTFGDFPLKSECLVHELNVSKDKENLRKYDPTPFIPKSKESERLQEIVNIQTEGLKKRLRGSKIENIIIGVSGGLDSTLALLVASKAVAAKNIFAYSMPGPGTTERTRQNARKLSESLGINFKEIPISEEFELHLKNIEHKDVDFVFENTQARIRTMHLFNLANKNKGLVEGTADLSEIALGWGTYNADVMSNYNVNASIPKTLIRSLVNFFKQDSVELGVILEDILQTKVSPELLPTKDGESTQFTEEILGDYKFHDFYLFHMIRNGFDREKIEYLSKLTFNDHKNETLDLFYKRFYQNQFKRSCVPGGPKVGSVSLSPRGDWRMPDES